MKLTVLGSGTMMPSAKRYPSGYLIDDGSTRILLDCGGPTVSRLVELGVNFREIEAMCLSHFHTDHMGGLLPFVHARWVDDKVTRRQHTELLLMGPKTLGERMKKLREVSWPEPEESFPLRLVEGPATESVGAINIETFETHHVEWFASVGYRITHKDTTLVYTGDVGSDHPWEDLVARAKGASVLLVGAAASEPAPNHLTVDQALKLGREAEVKKIVLTHLREQQLTVAKSKIQTVKNAVIAEDKMAITL